MRLHDVVACVSPRRGPSPSLPPTSSEPRRGVADVERCRRRLNGAATDGPQVARLRGRRRRRVSTGGAVVGGDEQVPRRLNDACSWGARAGLVLVTDACLVATSAVLGLAWSWVLVLSLEWPCTPCLRGVGCVPTADAGYSKLVRSTSKVLPRARAGGLNEAPGSTCPALKHLTTGG